MKKLIINNNSLYLVPDDLYKELEGHLQPVCWTEGLDLGKLKSRLRCVKKIMETCDYITIDKSITETRLDSVIGFFPLNQTNKELI